MWAARLVAEASSVTLRTSSSLLSLMFQNPIVFLSVNFGLSITESAQVWEEELRRWWFVLTLWRQLSCCNLDQILFSNPLVNVIQGVVNEEREVRWQCVSSIFNSLVNSLAKSNLGSNITCNIYDYIPPFLVVALASELEDGFGSIVVQLFSLGFCPVQSPEKNVQKQDNNNCPVCNTF